jgi:hypothetical protein
VNPTAISSPHLFSILTALQWQGETNDCGPFTAATVLNALQGLNIKGDQLALQMNRPNMRGPLPLIRRIPNWATLPWGMVDVFQEFGIRASWRTFVSPRYLQEGLLSGRILMPIIGSWIPLWAHVMTLLAWDPSVGWGFANTQRNDHQMDWVSQDFFLRHWTAMGRLLIEVREPST